MTSKPSSREIPCEPDSASVPPFTNSSPVKEEGDTARAEAFFTKARELERRSKTLHTTVQNHESLSADNVGDEQLRTT